MWHARFWDEGLQKYAHSRTTGILVEGKKEHRREAEEAAKKLFEKFALAKSKTQALHDAPNSAQKNTVANTPLIQYLSNFWTPNSEYAQFKSGVQKKPLTTYYIEMNHDDVRRHVEPFSGFAGVTVGSLNKAILKKWLIWLAGRKTQRRKKDGTIIEGNTLSGRRANTVLQAVRVAIRWAVDNEEIPSDPFRKLGEVSESIKEKGVLTFEERNKLTTLPVSDYRSRLFMLLGSFCGLRRGEMRGLQWGDIADGIITVQHNFVNKEGVKQPKYNSTRRVPIPTAVQKMLDIAYKNAFSTLPESYVFESPLTPEKPLNNNFFREGVVKELESIGITAEQQKKRVLTCHSLRHTFVTLAQLSGISDVEIRAMTGQKSAQVMGIYSHVPQVIDFDKARKKLELCGAEEAKAVNG
jgi:integrase